MEQDSFLHFKSYLKCDFNQGITLKINYNEISKRSKRLKGVPVMTVKVDKGACIGCGLCSSICPSVFQIDDDGLASVYANPVPEADTESVQEACDNCPVGAIYIEK